MILSSYTLTILRIFRIYSLNEHPIHVILVNYRRCKSANPRAVASEMSAFSSVETWIEGKPLIYMLDRLISKGLKRIGWGLKIEDLDTFKVFTVKGSDSFEDYFISTFWTLIWPGHLVSRIFHSTDHTFNMRYIWCHILCPEMKLNRNRCSTVQ